MSFGRWRLLTALLLSVGIGLAPAGHASAHTDFESSNPTDGDVVDSPLSQITIAFTNPAEEAGDGFQVFDGKGAVRTPDTIEVVDGRIFVLGFDPPVTPGEIGVRWQVRAGDAHPIDGSFTFTLNAPPATSPPTTAPPATAAPAASATTAAPANPAPTTAATAPPATQPPATQPATTTPTPDDEQDDAETAGSLDEFLAGDAGGSGGGLQSLGRAISLPAAVLAVGALVFLASTLRGTGREFAMLLSGAAIGGGALVAGAFLELFGWIDESGESFGDAVTSTPGLAMALRIVGGLGIVGAGAVAANGWRSAPNPRTSLSAAVVDAPPVGAADTATRWRIDTAPALAVGAAIVLVSFWFDGHTVSRGPRIVHSIVNSVHVGAAAVWGGGVVAFAAIAWWRHRNGEPSRATELIVRFSSIATVALIAVSLAGVAMTAMIIDGPGDLTGTEWGKTLLLKTGAVGLAAAMGAFNHFRLRPALEQSPDDPALAGELRRTLLAEVVVLVFVAVVTAWLVAAAV